jgi:TRAP-type C4-dicarboxylate transport system permease large subunit
MTNIVMLIVGMSLDRQSDVLLLGLIFVPLADASWLDRVQLGMIMDIHLGIDHYTPNRDSPVHSSTRRALH